VLELCQAILFDDRKPQTDPTLLGGEHLPGHLCRMHQVGLAFVGFDDLDDQARQVGRRAPQAGRGLFGIDVPFSGNRFAVPAVGRCCLWEVRLGKQGLERAVGHPQPVKDPFLGQIGERPAGHVLDHLLNHHVAAARVLETCSRRLHHPHRLGVGGWFAIQNLLQGGQWRAGRVAGKPIYPQPGGVREQAAQGRLARLSVFALGKLPRAQHFVHIGIQVQRSRFHQGASNHRRDRFADRGGLKDGFRCHRLIPTCLQYAIPLGPGQLAPIDEGDAKAGYPVRCHALAQGSSWRHQATFKYLYCSFQISQLGSPLGLSIIRQSIWRKAGTLGSFPIRFVTPVSDRS
jgi:hypothetical protein